MPRPNPNKFNFKEWQNHLDDTLDEQFPKGKCKQRGNALVLYAEFQIFISALIKDAHSDIKEIEDALCVNQDVNVGEGVA